MRSSIFFISCILLMGIGVHAGNSTRPTAPAEPLPAGVGQNWWSRIQADLQKEEYAVTWQDSAGLPDLQSAYQAPNRAQGFRTYFTKDGIRVEPMNESASWTWGLFLATTPIAGSSQPAAGRNEKPGIHVLESRIEFARGWITEWYVNSPEGLEQGFTIPRPLLVARSSNLEAGEAGDSELRTPNSELHIDLMLTGTLHPRFAEDGQAIDFFANGSIAVLHYAKLIVTDAAGRVLPARFEGWAGPPNSELPTPNYGGGVRIVVDAADAAYPITVDPLATTPSWTKTGEIAASRFGYSVATAGDVNGDGYSDVIVGAYYSEGQKGRTYLYLGGAAGLSGTAAWTQLGESNWDNFGCSLATAGDVNGDGYSDVVVGARGWGWPYTGKAYLYLGSATAPFLVASGWTATGEATGNYFGNSVATAGDVDGDGHSDVLVGADGYSSYTGKAYLYLGSATAPYLADFWTATGEAAGDEFGFSVATAGDVDGDGHSDVIVGAPGYGGSYDYGRAYVYLWSEEEPEGLYLDILLQPWGGGADTRLGGSVATAGDVNGDGYADVVVGGPGKEGAATSTPGMVWFYPGGSEGLPEHETWRAYGENSYDFFGSSVAMGGDVNGDGYSDVVIGAYYWNGGFGTGRAYLYQGGASGLSGTAGWTAQCDQGDALFGFSVGTAGDVNGDGYSDVIVGAFLYDNGQTDEGRAYVYHGATGGLDTSAAWTAESGQDGAFFGRAVGTAGDVNGDGYSDVIVGALFYDNGQADEGRAYVYLGSASGLANEAAWTVESDQEDHRLGCSVGTAGDVNGDGYSDVLVGADGYGNATGKAYLYLGSDMAPYLVASGWMATGEVEGDEFGYSVATAGDVNGDGYSDVVVGALGNASNTGKAYLYLGGASGLSPAASWTASGEETGNTFGRSVATAGDVNGDGYSDVLVGADGYSSYTGRAYLYLGSATAPYLVASGWTATGEAAGDAFGNSVGTAGDVNGDGYSDVIVGAFEKGRAYVFLGSASGLSITAAWAADGGSGGTDFGNSVGAAGDVNGDGFPDVIIGAPGMAYSYLGNEGLGVPIRPRQLRSDGIIPIAPLGRADEGQFRLSSLGRTPFGRGDVKLEWQAVPLGGSLDPADNPLQSGSAWSDSGTAGASLQQSLEIAVGPHLWRMRTRYSLTTTPFLGHGPWLWMAANALRETDLRRMPACVLPTAASFISSVIKSGVNATLVFQDANQADQRTGWNIRRSPDAFPDKVIWPLFGYNVPDGVPGTPDDIEWTDTAGGPPSGTVWYYQVTAYNVNCPAEGPF